MSEFRKQIAFGAIMAVLLAAGLAFGTGYYFPSPTAQTVTLPPTMTASTTVSSATAAVTSSVTTATSTATATMTMTTTSVVTSSTAASVSSITSSSAVVTTTITYTTTSGVTTCTQCPRLQIVSANITVSTTSQSFLSVAVRNGGSDNASNLTILVDSTKIAVILQLDAGQQTWLRIQLPASLEIQAGRSYQVTVNAQFSASTIGTSVGVVATRG